MVRSNEINERTSAVSDEQAMQDVMALLDEWQAPEPSPWFDGRMMARFREEQQRPAQGWLARLANRFSFGSLGHRPVLAGALAVAVLAAGGSYLGVAHYTQAAPASATLQDLQVLDNNDQAIQQMDQLLDGQDDSSSDSAL